MPPRRSSRKRKSAQDSDNDYEPAHEGRAGEDEGGGDASGDENLSGAFLLLWPPGCALNGWWCCWSSMGGHSASATPSGACIRARTPRLERHPAGRCTNWPFPPAHSSGPRVQQQDEEDQGQGGCRQRGGGLRCVVARYLSPQRAWSSSLPLIPRPQLRPRRRRRRARPRARARRSPSRGATAASSRPSRRCRSTFSPSCVLLSLDSIPCHPS